MIAFVREIVEAEDTKNLGSIRSHSNILYYAIFSIYHNRLEIYEDLRILSLRLWYVGRSLNENRSVPMKPNRIRSTLA